MQIRFDERGVETEYGHPTMPPRHTSTLLLILGGCPRIRLLLT